MAYLRSQAVQYCCWGQETMGHMNTPDELRQVLTRLNEDAIRAIASRAMERTANESDIFQGILAACKRNRLLSEPYRACHSAFYSELITGLCRLYDPPNNPRNAGLKRLIDLLSASEDSSGIDPKALASARQQFDRLKGDHRLQRIRSRRHQHLAHSAIEIVEPQKLIFGDVRSFLDDTLELLGQLNFLVTGSRKEFSDSIKFWHDLAEAFWRQFACGRDTPP